MFGPIAVTYNLAGVDGAGPGRTHRSPRSSTARSRPGTRPEITALNAGKTLPGDKINVVFRSDESGTTDNFQKYLDAASDGAWGKGAGKTFNGGVGEGAKGNEGTSAAIKSTPGSITYNEWSFAKRRACQIADIITSAGPEPVEADARRRRASRSTRSRSRARATTWCSTPSSFYKPTEAGAYPIMLATYEIVCSKYPDAEVGTGGQGVPDGRRSTDGQKGLADNGYIPIPDDFKAKLTDSHQRHLLVHS